MKRENNSETQPVTDAIRDLKDFVSERLRNPFLASLTVFFLIFNWRSIVYLFFSDTSLENRFEKISNEYSSHLTVYILPITLAFAYYYGKDRFFNYIEKGTANSHIERKTSETDKRIKEIDLETKTVDALNRLEDARSKNKEKEELNKKNVNLQKALDKEKALLVEEKSKVEMANIKKEETLQSHKLIVDAINLDMQYDLRDEKVMKVISMYNDNELDSLGALIRSIHQDIGRTISSDNISIVKLRQVGAGHFEIEHDILKSIELFSVGKYLIRRYLFTQGKLRSNKFNFTEIKRSAI